MNIRTVTACLTITAVFGLGVFTGLIAQNTTAVQNLTDSPQRVEQKRADLSGAPGMEVIASIAEYKKGGKLGRHGHHGLEVGYVLQGSMVQMPGHEPVLLPAGYTEIHVRDGRHGGFTVVGDTPLKLYSVHIVDKGKPLYVYAE